MVKPCKLFLLCAVGLSTFTLYAQQELLFKQHNLDLYETYNAITLSDGKSKTVKEQDFTKKFYNVLKIEGSIDVVFDSLKQIGRITDEDNQLVIYSWNIPDRTGYSNYYCLIQYYSKKTKKTLVWNLNENVQRFINNEQDIADTSNWYGCLYYQIVKSKFKGTDYYTLMGFNFNDLLSNKKVIETIRITETNQLTFETNIFDFDQRNFNRIIYEYGEHVQMTLNYNSKLDLIVFDHLSPSRPSLEGQYQFYGPDGSYDGFKFTNGKWIKVVNVSIGG